MVLCVEAVHFHVLCGHGAGLAEDEVGELSNFFDWADVSHDDAVVFAHLKDTVGKWDSHSHWEAFRDGDNKHNKRNNNAVNQTVDEFISQKVLVSRLVDNDDNERDSEDDNGGEEANVLQRAADFIKS